VSRRAREPLKRKVVFSLGPKITITERRRNFWEYLSREYASAFGLCVIEFTGNKKLYREHLHMLGYISVLYLLAYWTRLWIIQEVVLSGQIRLCFSNRSMDCRIIHDVSH
jgi:hypothetical protein